MVLVVSYICCLVVQRGGVVICARLDVFNVTCASFSFLALMFSWSRLFAFFFVVLLEFGALVV